MKRNLLALFFLTFPILLLAQKLKSIKKKFPNKDAIEVEYTVLKKNKRIKHGTYKRYFKKGQIKEVGAYSENKKNGQWEEYNYYGQLRRIRKYEKGKLISDDKFGIWKEVGHNGTLYCYDYDKKERVFPQILDQVAYPSKAREEGIGGIVKIKVKLDEECKLIECKVVKSLRADFDMEAIKGVKKYIEKLKYYKDDCKLFEKIITIDFKVE